MSMRVRTGDWAERDHVERWREEFGRQVIRADVVALAPQPTSFEAELDLHPGETLAVTEMRPRAVRKVHIGAWFGGGADSLTLMMCRSGTVRYDMAGRRHVLRPGEAVLFSHRAPVAFEWDDASIVTVQLDRSSLDGGLDDRVGQPIDAANPYSRLLRSYADAICANGIAMTPLMERHVLELARASVADAPACASADRQAALGEARLESARRVLARQACDPLLRIDHVARALAISPRTLQRDFARVGANFGTELLAIRLSAAHGKLRDSKSGTMGARVGDLALEVGFNDLSHFNRSFRDRYGCSPTQVRARAAVERFEAGDRTR